MMRINCQRLVHILLSVAIMVHLTGCAPAFFKYRYISLEPAEGLEIVEFGSLTDDRLFFHEEMPLAYLLSRGSYDLKFEIVTTNLAGGMTVTVVSKISEDLFLHGDDEASDSGGVTFDRYRKLPGNVLRFNSNTEFMFGGRDGFAVVFDVVDGTRGPIARESFEFKRETNGFYMIIDAI